MRSDWERVVYAILLVTGMINCVTVYTDKPRDEIGKPKEKIEPIPESLLAIPTFNGHDTMQIFNYKGREVFSLYNNGKVEYQVRPSSMAWYTRTANIRISEIEEFILTLNELGLFGITQENVIKKRYQKRSIPCFIVPFIDYYTPSRVQDGPERVPWCIYTRHTIEVDLLGLRRRISYHNIEYAVEKYPEFEELQILKKSMDFIETFIRRKTNEFESD